MGVVWYAARPGLRRHAVATIALGLVVALAGATVMAAVAGARRGAAAIPHFVRYNNASDVQSFFFGGVVDPAVVPGLVEQIMALPQWEAATEGRPVVVSVHAGDHWVTTVPVALARGPYFTAVDRPIVVDGALPDPWRANQAVVNEAFADALGLHAGDRFSLRTITPDALGAASQGQITRDPAGEDLEMTVAAVIRRPPDLGDRRNATSDVFGTDTWFVALGPAFLHRFEDRIASYGDGVQGRARPGQVEPLARAITAIVGPNASPEQGDSAEETVAAARRAADLEANALLIFALVAAVTATALLTQVVARRVTLDLDDDDARRASGMRRAHRMAVPLVPAAEVALIGSIGAVALSWAASPLFPIGVAARAELDPGLDADLLVLLIGGLAILAMVVGAATLTAWRGTAEGSLAPDAVGAARRPSSIGDLAARAGAPITAVTGIRLALERGRGRTAVPVVGAAMASTIGVLILTTILVVTASVDHLVDTPALQGWTWDATVGNLNDEQAVQGAVTALRENDRVAAYLGLSTGPIIVDGHDSYAAAIGRGDPSAGPQATEGRLPRTRREVAVGRQTLDDLGKEVGDTVEVAAAPGAPTTTARVVGTVVLPASLEPQLTLGRGVLMTGAMLAQASGGQGPWVPNTFLVTFRRGTSREAGLESLRPAFGATAGTFRFADDVENVRRVQKLPRALAALVGLLAVGTLANTLVTSVRRRRRVLATFASVGFRRRQLAATVAWQATTFSLLAVLVGLPLGVAAGRTIWRSMASALGVAAEPVVPVWWLVGLVALTIAAANVVAALPARSAARTSPAEALRAE